MTGWAVRNVERLVEELDHHQVNAGRLTLWLESRDSLGWGRRAAFPSPTSSFAVLAGTAKRIIEATHFAFLVSGMHEADRLARRTAVQRILFPLDSSPSDRAAAAKKAVNDKFGRFAVRSGETLQINAVYTDETNDFDICDIHDKTCF